MDLYELLYGAPSPGWDEEQFRSWYSGQASKLGLNPDPDHPEHFYDYRAAFRAGVGPDPSGHWPSQFKLPGHPNEIVNGINTRTGLPEIPQNGPLTGLGATLGMPPPGSPLGPPKSTLGGSQAVGPPPDPSLLRDVGLKSLLDLGAYGVGAGETALSLGSGMMGMIPAGLAGIGATLRYGPEAGKKTIEDISSASMYRPRTEAGMAGLETAMKPLEWLQQGADVVGTEVTDVTTPYVGEKIGGILGATSASFVEALPLVFGEINMKARAFNQMLGEAGSLETFPQWKMEYVAKARQQGIPDKVIQNRLRAFDQTIAVYEKHKGLLPEATPGVSPLRTNAFDIVTADFDAICPKREYYGPTIAEVERRLKKPLDEMERFDVGMSLRKHGHTAPCAYCMIESARSFQAEVAVRAAHEMGIPERALVDTGYREFLEKKDPTMAARIAKLEQRVAGQQVNQPKTFAAYGGQLLRKDPSSIQKLNDLRGLRFNSATDMKPEHVLDKIQMVHDGHLVGQLMYEYTKVPENVEIFGRTGIKQNMSIAAKGGKGMKIMEDPVEGMPWDTARAFARKYDDSGIILLATNHEQIVWGGKTPWIGEIIPNHRSGMSRQLREFLGYDDFTSIQSEKWKNPDAHRIQDPKTGRLKLEPTPTIGPKQHGNSKTKYLRFCEENGLIPKFKDYVDEKWYMKLIVDHTKPGTKHRVPDPRKINWKKAAEWVDKWGEQGGTLTAPKMDVVEDVVSRLLTKEKKAPPYEIIGEKKSIEMMYFDKASEITPPEGILAAEDVWSGGVADLGDSTAGYQVQGMKGYFDYKSQLESAARETLGDRFKVYRAMTPDQYAEWKAGADIGPIGVTTDKAVADAWHKVAANKNREFIVVEMEAPAESIVMRGKPEESEIVIDGNAVSFHELRVVGGKAEPSLKEKFHEVGSLQRGEPEQAMVMVQRAAGGGELWEPIMDIGDLTHRMSEEITDYNAGYESVLPKVKKSLRYLIDVFKFDEQIHRDFRNNARLAREEGRSKLSDQEFTERVYSYMQKYADAHKKLPAYNEAQRLARDAAVAMGERRFFDARSNLEELAKHLGSSKEWRRFARQGIDAFYPEQVRTMILDESGKPKTVYHGTTATISGEFGGSTELSKLGWSYFSDSPEFAEKFAYSPEPLPKPPGEMTTIQIQHKTGLTNVTGYKTPIKGITIAEVSPGRYSLTHNKSGYALGFADSIEQAMDMADELARLRINWDISMEEVKTKLYKPVTKERISNALYRGKQKQINAESAAMFGYKQAKEGFGKGSNIYPANLEMKKPLDLRKLPAKNVHPERVRKFLAEQGIEIPQSKMFFGQRDLYQMLNQVDFASALREAAIDQGFDGIIFNDYYDPKTRGVSYIAFYPEQVRSVFKK